MPIDYSKWDKIELSDDSDVEVHPNVDKRSFIRWKQRDIHEKRQQRNLEIKSILVQLTMYAKLNERVDYLMKNLANEEWLDEGVVGKKLNEQFDKKEKFDYEALKLAKGNSLRKGLQDLHFDKEEFDNMVPYNEMIEDLVTQAKEDHPELVLPSENFVEHIKEHRNKIDDILSKKTGKLDVLLQEKSSLISSEDVHTGFDRSFMNRDKEESALKSNAAAPQKEKESTMEVINSPGAQENKTQGERDILDELTVLPETAKFGEIPISDLSGSAEYMIRNTKICTEQQKDALIMTAFDHQLQGRLDLTKKVIHQSLLLQYVAQLVGPKPNKDQTIRAIKLFFTKISDSSSPARMAFEQDVENTFNHIKGRCEVIKQEQATKNEGSEEEEAQIQLKELDENTELQVNIPEQGTAEYTIFSTKLSPEMQQAINSKSLDQINEVLGKMKVPEAEEVLAIFQECGIISINGYLENENEFKELQDEYRKENKSKNDHSPADDTAEQTHNTADTVD